MPPDASPRGRAWLSSGVFRRCPPCPAWCRVSRLTVLLCLFLSYLSFTLGSYIYASYTLSHISTLCPALYSASVALIVLLVVSYVAALACFCHVYRNKRRAYRRWKQEHPDQRPQLHAVDDANGVDQEQDDDDGEDVEVHGSRAHKANGAAHDARNGDGVVRRRSDIVSPSSLTESLLASNSADDFATPAVYGSPRALRSLRGRCPSCSWRCAAIHTAWTLWFLLLVVLFVVCVAVFALVIFLQVNTLPKTTGVMGLPGLLHPVMVSRDDNDLIHVQGYNRHDVYYAQGVVMMQERMWQMEMQRAVGRGRLQELVGANDAADEVDRVARLMGFYEAAVASLPALDDESRRGLSAFCEGINAYLDSNPPLGVEYYLLGLSKPEPWQLEDVVVWAKVMSFLLSANMDRELQRWQLKARGLSNSRIDQLMPDYDITRFPTILPDSSHPDTAMPLDDRTVEEPLDGWLRARPDLLSAASSSSPSLSALRAVLGRYRAVFGPTHASNSWVVGGSHTHSGHPLLCNDPHLPLMAPSLWILFHLQVISGTSRHTEDVIGASLAGIPGVIIGRNNVSAWAATNTGADVQDLYIMDDSVDHTQYRHNGSWLNYTFTTATIRRKGARDRSFTFRSSLYGPVVSDLLGSYTSPLPLSLRWTSLQANDTTVNAFLGINRARDHADFVHALRSYVAPSQNFLYADAHTIAYHMPGRIPTRVAGHSGKFPVPGNGSCDWTGVLAFEQLPAVLNPKQDWLVTANNRVTDRHFPVQVSADWDEGSDGYRALRIQQMLLERNHTVKTMVRMQADVQSLLFTDLQPVLQQLRPGTDAGRQWQQRLGGFDGVMSVGSEEATVFQLWFNFLCTLPVPEINETLCNPVYLYNVLVNGQPDPNCDSYQPHRPPHSGQRAEDERTGMEHRHGGAVAAASPGCLAWASDGFDAVVSGSLSAPRWGTDVKQVMFAHQVLSGSPLSCLSNRRVAHGGDDFTVDVGHYSMPLSSQPFYTTATVPATVWQKHGPSYRQVVDLRHPNGSLYQPSMGQSGNLISPWYDDTLQAWADVQLLPMRTVGFERSYVLWLRSDGAAVPDDPNDVTDS